MSSRSAPAGRGPGAEAPGRCGHCGARLNSADEWCTLCHTPVLAADDEMDARPPGRSPHDEILAGQAQVPEQGDGIGRGRSELSPERIEHLLERLAAAETQTQSPTGIGVLDGLTGKGKGQALLLAGAGGLVLLAGGLLALYVLGTLL